MVRFTIENDQLHAHGEVDQLGIPYPNLAQEIISDQLSNTDYFPFTRCCFSIGDWGIISGLPEVFSEKYPKLKFLVPSKELLQKIFPTAGNWSYDKMNPATYIDLVFANNPYVEFVQPNQFTKIYCDHERSYRFQNEPLAEQIMRYFGFTEEEISRYDSRPNIYFSEEEIQIGNYIIEKYLGRAYLRRLDRVPYDCLLFASRLDHLNNMWPENFKSIQNIIKYCKTNDLAFYYSSFDIKESYWIKLYPELGTLINFKDIPEATLRIQWYIKSKADKNISYQSGFNDTISRYSDHHVATHRIGTGETTVRGVTYYQNDGAIIKFI